MTQAIELIQTTTINMVAQLCNRHNITLDSKTLADRLVDSRKEWIQKIIDEARKDAERADLFNGLSSGKINPLVKTSFAVALEHGCLLWAKHIAQVN